MGDDRGVAAVAAPPDDAVGAQPRRWPTRSTATTPTRRTCPGSRSPAQLDRHGRPREGVAPRRAARSSACRRTACGRRCSDGRGVDPPVDPGRQPDQGPRAGIAAADDRGDQRGAAGHPAAALTGPNIAREIMAGQAAASVIATEDLAVAAAIQQVLTRGLFRIYTNHDVIGCELGGALKNVVAIACRHRPGPRRRRQHPRRGDDAGARRADPPRRGDGRRGGRRSPAWPGWAT